MTFSPGAKPWVTTQLVPNVRSATTVRAADSKSQVLDGPYAETKEQLAGFYLIDVPDLDAAISWATRCPGAARGAIEVLHRLTPREGYDHCR